MTDFLNACSKCILLVLFFIVGVGLSMPSEAQEKTKTERFLKEDLDVFANDNNGWTHLHWAAAINDTVAISILVNQGAFIDSVASTGKFDKKDLPKARLLGIKDNWCLCSETPLFIALYLGSEDAAILLIKSGANINAVNDFGNTTVYAAAHGDSDKAFKILIDNGVEYNNDDVQGVAQREKSHKVIKIIDAMKEDEK